MTDVGVRAPHHEATDQGSERANEQTNRRGSIGLQFYRVVVEEQNGSDSREKLSKNISEARR